ncbi:MAG: SUMF1/EgtB/PvdO family nonheme iron enzyme, partial [Acidobacteria bacterium]|nr:SUMF1/EgtB/PvdO family nonheme iron enzyme [Acidobacteriota bacterium]
REWFYFDQQRKPIYPLYVADCELHTRLFAYNYVDARQDLQGALTRILEDLRRDFSLPEPITEADKVSVFETVASESHSLPENLQALQRAISGTEGDVVLSVAEAVAIRDHQPADLAEYRLGRIAEWSLPKFQINKRFVNLTLLLDKGEHETQRWQRPADSESYRFNDLRDVLAKTREHPALVLLGAPGSGKSTLLRRLQLDHSIDCLRDGAEPVSVFVPLNSYRAHAKGELPEPGEWLNQYWKLKYPQLPPLESLLQDGRALLLLDALNEMPHKSTADYQRLVGLWRDFVQDVCGKGNRVIFSCRSLDYSASLSSKELRVPQVEVQPMTAEQARAFLTVYQPAHQERIWHEINGTREFTFYQTPYFLKLLCEQVNAGGDIPKGRAGLFTGFVRQSLKRELNGELFQLAAGLLSEADHEKLSLNRWRNEFELPERGMLFPKLSELAFTMQQKGLETEGAQVRIDFDDACDLLADGQPGALAEALLKAGIALNVLDKDVAQYEILFFHQLLQEYFAARRLAKAPNPALVHVEWQADKVSEPLAETLAKLADGDPLPPLAQTGWEETTLTAAPMAKDSTTFVRDLIEPNLPLAARCAAAPEVQVSPELKRDLQQRLIERTQDQRADVRARIAAGEALGLLGDPRFERRSGEYGDYLLPPLVTIPGGEYTIGVNKSDYDDEKPAGAVELAEFQIGQFPVTNAEYKLFMEAGGYEDERWWDTPEAQAWLSGEGAAEGQKQGWRDFRERLLALTDEDIRGLVKENRITTKQAEDWITIRNWTEEEFEGQLEEKYPAGKRYHEPEVWSDARFNNPAQPVVGVTWFEARAYCNWLTANAANGLIYRLPTEAEFEAAARGKKGRQFPYGKKFDSAKCNTFESHIRRTTPVGVFDNS